MATAFRRDRDATGRRCVQDDREVDMDDMKRRIREEVALQKARLHEQGQRAGPGGPVQGGARPQPGPPGLPDVEAMMRRVRATVAHRKSIERPRPAGGADRNRPAAGESTGGAAASIALPGRPAPGDPAAPADGYRLADFLQYHDDEFVRHAYRALLGREPDVTGRAEFLAALRSGRWAKIEILGRIRFSAEGRAGGVRVRGLALRFALRTVRRVPVVGRLVGMIQYVIRLPEIVANHERLEAALFQREHELKRRLDADEARIDDLACDLRQTHAAKANAGAHSGPRRR